VCVYQIRAKLGEEYMIAINNNEWGKLPH
jgi:hypothetical protein